MNYVNGQMQKSLVSDQGPSLPRFGVRKRIAENKQKEMQEYLAGLKTLLDQYTLPTAGKVLDFINQAKPSAPDAQNVVVIAGSGVVVAGDSLSIWTDMATRKTLRVQVIDDLQGGSGHLDGHVRDARERPELRVLRRDRRAGQADDDPGLELQLQSQRLSSGCAAVEICG